MSKFNSALKYTMSNKRMVDPVPMRYGEMHFSNSEAQIDNSVFHQLDVRLEFGCRSFINQVELLLSRDDSVLTEAIKKMKRSIVEEVFGEFRKDIENIRHALYERDVKKAQVELDNLYLNMFENGL
jgi:hypothetical protein